MAALVASPNGEYMTFTPSGFFAALQRDTDMLAIARGMGVTTIGQVYQSLFNPDLVREALARDPHGEVAAKAKEINLEKVLDSGPAPQAEIVSHSYGSKSDTDVLVVAARITDRGKGIGRIEWRVNGITVGVTNAPARARKVYEVSQRLALDRGENAVEVIAYNASNMLASLPGKTTIAYTGAADGAKPKLLHILAIGINQYVDPDLGSPYGNFPALKLAVPDAVAFADGMKKAGEGLYGAGNVKERRVLDTSATVENLARVVEEMAKEVSPRDTFLFYAAAHGHSDGGRFYMIPQDYQAGGDPKALAARAIGQDRLQDWIANKIKAKKVVILLDTCESGALTNGFPASDAGMGRLHEATGRPVLTAAASRQSSLEGVIGETGEKHGVFTWAVLDALRNGDANGNGVIELNEIVDHVQKVVPGIAKELVVAWTSAGPVYGEQTPRYGSVGEDFAIAARLP